MERSPAGAHAAKAPAAASQSPRTLVIVGGVTLALALSQILAGTYVLKSALVPPREVDVAALLDPAQVEAGELVTVRVTPDVRTLSHVLSGSANDFLLLAEEDSRLVIYAPRSSELGDALASNLPLPRRDFVLTGLVHDLGNYSRLKSDIPGYVVDEYGHRMYGDHPGRARVLDLGASRAQLAFIGIGSMCACGLPLIVLALYAFLRARSIHNARRAPLSF